MKNSLREGQGMPNIITTVAGTGEKGFAGDGGPAREALLNRFPQFTSRQTKGLALSGR